MYELCCGHPPHDLQRVEDVALAAKLQDAPPLLGQAPDVSRGFAAIIHRCLDRDGKKRYASGVELQRALEELSKEVGTPTARAVLGRAILRRWPVAIIASALLVVPPVLALYHFYQMREDTRQLEAMVKNRRSLAVVPLAMSAPPGIAGQGGFGAAFAELLSAELAVGERLRRVPAESVARMQMDLKLSAHLRYSKAELAAVRQQLGVDLFVAGTYQPEDAASPRLHIHINVYDTQLGQKVGSAQLVGSQKELFGMPGAGSRRDSTVRHKVVIPWGSHRRKCEAVGSSIEARSTRVRY